MPISNRSSRRVSTIIGNLLRTNTALALLCVISIGVFIILWRGRYQPVQTLKVDNVPMVAPGSPTAIPTSQPAMAEAFRDMPSPDTFITFVYDEADPSISVVTTCADEYAVVIIFPSNIDYRSDVLSARYNAAEPCAMGKTNKEKISLAGYGFQDGQKYYVIKASQGKKGLWHDPY